MSDRFVVQEASEIITIRPSDIAELRRRKYAEEPQTKGGAGSGNWGHRGRAGSEGGSLARGSSTSPHLSGDVVVFDKTPGGGEINGIPIKHAEPRDWTSLPDRIEEPPAPNLPPGMKLSAGVVCVEPDGRIWVVEPSGHFGGYEHTFAKGRIEPGHTMQQTAMKEAYEEMGLNVQLTGHLRDAEGSTTITRYYTAKRLNGDPADAHWETDKVKLATPDSLKTMLNVKRDRETLSQLMSAQKGGPGSGNWGHAGRSGKEGGSVGRGRGSGVESRESRKKPKSSFQSRIDSSEIVSRRNQHASALESAGISRDQARSAIQRIAEGGTPSIRLGPKALEGMVDKGYYTNTFETGVLTPTSLAIRAKIEENILGIPADALASEHPVYGYMRFDDFSGGIQGTYGAYELRLKPEVLDRASMTLGDTWRGYMSDVTSTSVRDPDIEGIPKSLVQAQNVKTRESFTRFAKGEGSRREFLETIEYVELQIHGGVKLSDIDRIIDHDGSFTEGIAKYFEQFGIPVEKAT